VTARGATPDRAASVPVANEETPEPTSRTVYLRGKPAEVAVYPRAALRRGETIAGPVIIEERETTVFVLPDWSLDLHENGSLIAKRNKGAK
jgi:N-methylhydantoinase A